MVQFSGEQVRNGETLFSGLSAIEQQHILDRCIRRSVCPRSVIVSQGSCGRDMYIVESGSLKVSVLSPEGKEVAFVMLRQGDYFGELAMIDGRRRSATVTAMEKSELLVLGYSEYQKLLQQHPLSATQFLTRMLVTLADRLRITDELYQDSVFLDVSARLAKFLLNTSVAVSDSDPMHRRIDVRISQYELGTLVNASRESVNKQLRDWQSQGIVAVEQGKITLLDMASLQQQAEEL